MRGLPSRYRPFVSWCVSILWLSLPSAALPASTAFGVDASSSNFASFGLTTPDTITAITPYANFTWAGDFWVDGVMYQINASTNNLESVTADGIITIIGPSIPPGPETWTGMATDPTTETMYAVTADCFADSFLYTIDVTTGAATLVGSLGDRCVIAVAIDDAGQAYGYGVIDDELFSIDLGTGLATTIGPIGFDANFAQGMDYDSYSDTFFMAAYNYTTGRAELRSVNTTTGHTTLVGPIGPFEAEALFGWIAFDSSAGLDSDGDGVPDSEDACLGFDDTDDMDDDLVPDGCDDCPLDPDNDVDGDGVCGDVDPCPTDATDACLFVNQGHCIAKRIADGCSGLTGRARAACNHTQQQSCRDLF